MTLGLSKRVGIATDHGGFALKEELVAHLRSAGHEVIDFGAHTLNPGDDYPDFVIPLAKAVAAGEVERGMAICGSGVGASVCANKIPGVRAGLIHDHFSARQGVEDDHMNIICMGGRTVGPAVAWDLVQTFLAARVQPSGPALASPRQSGCSRSANDQTDKDETCECLGNRASDDGRNLTSCRSTPSAPSPSTRSSRRSPDTPARRWRWRRSSTRIWNRVMRFDPQDPIWPNRDRFVLSNGHASMLLWSVLHLTGTQAVNADYEILGEPAVTLDDIRHFRQLGSKAPGHPEYHWVSGVETTTGPLGQGVATSVGMAIGREVARQPLQPARLRHLRLQHLCRLRRWLHDGGRRLGGGVARRPPRSRQPLLDLRQQPHHHRREYEHHLHGGHRGPVPRLMAGTSCGSVTRMTSTASSTPSQYSAKTKGRPTFIVLDSHIGYGSPHKQDTSAAHGEPLGDEEVRLCKRVYGWPEDAQVPRARRCLRALRGGDRRPRRSRRGVSGRNSSRRIEPSIPNWRPRST